MVTQSGSRIPKKIPIESLKGEESVREPKDEQGCTLVVIAIAIVIVLSTIQGIMNHEDAIADKEVLYGKNN